MSIGERYPVVVVGGGPAGLATSAALRRRRIGHVVVERGAAAGHSWMHFYDSLTLHTGKHLSSLPGLSFDRRVPIFPSRADFVAYLHRYVEVLELPVETNAAVTAIDRHGDGNYLDCTLKLTFPPNPNGIYVLKGGGPDVWRKFGVPRCWRRSQGMIQGKRCGVTENIGPA